MDSQVQMPGANNRDDVQKQAPLGPVLWDAPVIMGMAWRVWITNKNFHPQIEDHNGWTECDSAEIYISANVDDARKPEVLIHELMHACFFTIGYEFTVSRFIENQKIDAEEREEARVSALSPIIFDTFFRNGMLNLKPIPPEAALLRTAA